ncbi:MAG: BMP family ABC transporter substrate-binding protein [Alkaliphilus sp.]|nr:BMP family ABC transporter substrate-binding protein [Alkaliphilus sp. AH-315-G20]PHS32802.1 MAG: BMP family ABC transporter substrate-binding protein [Alkaliphilus sp.]
MFKKIFVLALVVVMMATALVGCGATEEEEGLSMAMVTDVGGVNDQSFNQSAWEGHQRAEKELGFNVSYLESNQDADYHPNMETLMGAGNDLIWGIGFKMGDTILEAANNNPDQKFAIIDYAYGDDAPDNIVGVLFKEQEPSFLVGYIAGKMTETGKVGFVGGMEFPVIHRFQYGFLAGVAHADPSVEVFVQYADSFVDAAIGKAITKQMYLDGADIVFHAAGGVGDGVIAAALEEDKWAIGVDRDQNDLAPDNVLTSAMKRVDNAIFNVAEMLKEGNFPGGETVVIGLAEGGVGIAPTSDKHVPADLLAEVAELEKKIIAGDIVVPYSEETFEASR